METRTRLTATDRHRAFERLRRATVGTAVAGVAALIGFGAVAAISNPGKPASDVTTADYVADPASPVATAQPAPSAFSGGSGFQRNTTPVARPGGRGHATSGGS